MKKLKRGQAQAIAGIGVILSIGLLIWLNTSKTLSGEFVKPVNVVWGLLDFILTILVLGDLIQTTESDYKEEGWLSFMYTTDDDDDDDDTTTKTLKLSFSFKQLILTIVGIYLLIKLIVLISTGFNDCTNIFNKAKIYQNTYNNKVEEKKGFYDKLWKTYLQKEKITNVNKETFIEVTKIIMENRKDGKDVMWKWVSENQQIPYNEFTKFYSDLSDFITNQREGYFNIEKECQKISNSNNTLLDTFPNNLYNKILKLPRINFEYGFTSDSTENVFKNRKENLK